jgi:hypothetical protein
MPRDRGGDRPLPTGECWCGCGKETSIGAFFVQGHDKLAEAALLAVEFDNSVAKMVRHHGYGPERNLLDAAVEVGGWARCSQCWYAGRPASVDNHTRSNHK